MAYFFFFFANLAKFNLRRNFELRKTVRRRYGRKKGDKNFIKRKKQINERIKKENRLRNAEEQ